MIQSVNQVDNDFIYEEIPASFVQKEENPVKVAGEEDLICNALVKEIGRAPTWLGVIEAWQALLRVRRMARELHEEHKNNGETGP